MPMFLAYKKGIKLRRHQSHVALRLRRVQHFAARRRSASAAWSGWRWAGVYAQPNLRGGGEYGEAWHQAGTRSCTSRTCSTTSSPPPSGWSTNRYTRPERLAIQGGSNGGLLVGAVMTQRPDLFGACLPGRGRDGHAAVPEVHRGADLGRRLRLERRSRSSSRRCWRIRPITTSSRGPATRPL